MTEDYEYTLGTDREELERLRFQHRAWLEEAYALWKRAGLRAGQTLVDLGCGPGFTSIELANLVGPRGRVIARDESERFLAFLRGERERLALTQLEPSLGRVEDLELAPGSLDAAYARWLLCWVPDARAVLERVAHGLARGGAVILQEYVDWAAMKLIPRSAGFDAVVAACMRSWADGGATIDIGDHLPSIAEELGLTVEHFRPNARIGRVGSLEWRWLEGFFESYLPRLVRRGILRAEELEAHRREWGRRAAAGTSHVFGPIVVDVILRKP